MVKLPQKFDVVYNGDNDLDLTLVTNATITGNAGAAGITGLEGQTASLEVAPTDSSTSTTISATVSLSA